MNPALELPRSVLLALWLQGVGAGADPLRRAVAAVEGDDEPHVVTGAGTTVVPGVPDGGTLAELLSAWAAGPRAAAALLPVPGDVTGLPPEVAAEAVEAGECVLAHAQGRAWAAVPEIIAFGSVHDTGHLVSWRVHEVPDWRPRLPGIVGTLSEAERSLRECLRDATEALAQLDVARWREDAADTIAALRSDADPGWPLPDRLAGRAVRVLATAVRLRTVVDLATVDDGGAVNLWQADQRSAALRHVDHAARRAVAAATAQAAGPPIAV
ncbi:MULTISPECIES: hypothetical protein [unclassified Actinotalea]|uniref:hypothetical protein n=1 Tax=unclassified Actinotalea TaxID=2638618 RepID=UPI0015F58BD9|nr:MULTISPECIES: hypothetical protein [unclassified Actinotalea]